MLWKNRRHIDRLSVEEQIREIKSRAGLDVEVKVLGDRRDPWTVPVYSIFLEGEGAQYGSFLDIVETALYLEGILDGVRALARKFGEICNARIIDAGASVSADSSTRPIGSGQDHGQDGRRRVPRNPPGRTQPESLPDE